MTGAIMFCDDAPVVTERSGMFVVEIGSGSERVSYCLTQKAVSMFAYRLSLAVQEVTTRRANVVPLAGSKRRKKRA